MIDVFAKRYGWTIEYIMSLTRRQIRLLTVSAGDHERMPEEDSQDGQDLTAPKDFEIKQEHIDRIRKAVANDGSKIGHKSPVVDKYIGRKFNVDYKKPTNPVTNRTSNQPGKGGVKDIIDMARKGQGNIKMGNKLKKKLSK